MRWPWDHDTPQIAAQFAAASIRAWWRKAGKDAYRRAGRIQIMADSGGSNGVCHYPPGTSEWNRVEHRLFSFISRHCRGEPLESFETIVKLISTTTTEKGLKVHCQLDEYDYPTKIKGHLWKLVFPGWIFNFFMHCRKIALIVSKTYSSGVF
jgi:hypothetical protein